MVRAIAYKMQARRYGGLKSAIVRQLCKIAGGKSDRGTKCAPWAPALDPDGPDDAAHRTANERWLPRWDLQFPILNFTLFDPESDFTPKT